MHDLKKIAAAMAGVAMLSACHGDGIDSVNNSGANPSLGLVQNATVNFYQADGTTLLGSGDTGTDGSVQVNAGGYRGPVVVEVLGDDTDAMYFDESTGTLVAFPAGNSLHALVPNATSRVGVTPLTEIAYQAALAQSLLPITADAVNQLNQIVGDALAPGLDSVLSIPTRFDENTMAGALDDNEAGRYALVLAALAELNSGDASPALTTLNALVADLADGVIDGQNNSSPVPNAGWGANFINAMSAALNAVASNFGTADLQGNAASQAPANTTVDTSNVSNGGGNTGGGDMNGETVPGTINTALVGTFDLVYAENAPGAPFTDGQTVQVVVGSDNSLTLPGGTQLTNPFYRVFGVPNEAEIIWLDSTNNIEYGLSDNSGGNFNEINLGDASNPQSSNGIPGFLGQLRMADTGGMNGGPPPELAAIAGQYMGQIVSKSGSFSRGRSLEDMVLVNIDTDSVVTVDSQFEFDPDAAGYEFRNNRSNPNESHYRVQVGDNENSMQFDIIFEDADSTDPIAYRLQSTEALGGGSFRVSTLELEERPLPTEVTDFFSAMIADSPVALTAVSVDAGFNSPFAVCDELSLISDNGGTVNSSNSRTPFRYRLNGANDQFRDSEIYRRSYARYADNNGDESLLFLRNRITRRADGFIDFTGTDAQNADRSRATNDPSQISAACGGETLVESSGQGATQAVSK